MAVVLFSENFNGNAGSPLFSANGTFNGTGFQATPAAGQLDSDFWRITGFSDNAGLLDYGGTGITANTDYVRGLLSGDPSTAGVYAVNTGIAALGASSFVIQPTSAEFGTTPGTITLRVQYTGPTALTGFSFDYDAVFRNNAGRESFANFSWAVQSSASQPTSFSSTVSALSYTTPITLDALGWQRTDLAAQSFTTTINTNDYIFLRWTIGDLPGGSGSRDELGFDNLVLTGNDTPPPPTISIAPTSISQAEGNSGTTAYTHTITRSDTSADTSVQVTIAGGSGFDAADISSVTVGGVPVAGFTLGTPFTVSLTGTNTTASVVINVAGDTTVETNETFTVTLASPTGGYTLGTSSATDTVTNDDVGVTHQIADIQGVAHISSFVTALNTNSVAAVTVEGIVTARDSNGFFIQDDTPDSDARTSDAIFVFTSSAPAGTITVGERVTVTGNVYEFQQFNNLPETQLRNVSIVESNTTVALPSVVVGAGGLLPALVGTNTDDFNGGLANPLTPTTDGTDFWESLEGMRVSYSNPVVADGFWYSFNGFYVYSADAGASSTPNTRGGITMSGGPGYDPALGVLGGGEFVINGDINPERIQVDFSEAWNPGFGSLNTQIDMGDRLEDIFGIVRNDFSNWKLFATATPTFEVNGNDPDGPTPEVTTLAGAGRQLLVSSFNVENLDPTDDATLDEGAVGGTGKFNDLARMFATNMNSPDVLLVSEVQDNNGPGGSPTTLVDASVTWTRLVQAIRTETGRDYVWVDQEPVANVEGGQQTGNIRVGFIYDRGRIELGDGTFTSSAFSGFGPGATQAQVDAAAAANLTAAADRRAWTDRIGDNARDAGDLITVSDDMLGGVNTADWAGTRKSLLGEFTFAGQSVFLTANHWPSKGGSGAPYFFNPANLTADGANADWLERKNIAEDVWSIAEYLRLNDPTAHVVFGGDLNEFYFYDPLRVLEGRIDATGAARGPGQATLVNLTTTLPEAERFTYTFDGNSQALDHIFVGSGLADISTYDALHVNTGYNSVRVNPGDRALSDHDPVLVQIAFQDLAETLNGTPNADTIQGFGGNDVINGLGSADVLDGGAGNDDITFDALDTSVVGGSGFDIARTTDTAAITLDMAAAGFELLYSGSGNDTITGIGATHWIGVDAGAGNDSISGTDQGDILGGNAGNDVIFGFAGADLVAGGGGSDRILAGQGADVVYGEADADSFVFQGLIDGGDTIMDFENAAERGPNGDKIEVYASGFDLSLASGTLAADRFVAGQANQAFGLFLYDSGTGNLWWDGDGTGAGSSLFLARIQGTNFAALSANDFVVV